MKRRGLLNLYALFFPNLVSMQLRKKALNGSIRTVENGTSKEKKPADSCSDASLEILSNHELACCGALIEMWAAPVKTVNEQSNSEYDPKSKDLFGAKSSEGSNEESASEAEQSVDAEPDYEMYEDRYIRSTVGFLHLSVRDFLDKSGTWRSLDPSQTSIPDAYIPLLRSNFGLLKLFEKSIMEWYRPRNRKGFQIQQILLSLWT